MTNQTNSVFSLLNDSALVHHSSYIAGQFQSGRSGHFAVHNPADGSYYIESLTIQLAEKSLALFKDIEASGGFLKLLNDGTIKKKIQESANKEQELFDSKKEILLGTNKYPNKEDRMKHDLELFPFVKIKPRKTLITPIIEIPT